MTRVWMPTPLGPFERFADDAVVVLPSSTTEGYPIVGQEVREGVLWVMLDVPADVALDVPSGSTPVFSFRVRREEWGEGRARTISIADVLGIEAEPPTWEREWPGEHEEPVEFSSIAAAVEWLSTSTEGSGDDPQHGS